jgi:hypothetical protein
VLRFEVFISVIRVHREFCARFKKCITPVWWISFKLCTKLTLHCNHRPGHLKTEHTERLLLLRRHLGNWSRGPVVSMKIELLLAYDKLEQFPLLAVYVMSLKSEK